MGVPPNSSILNQFNGVFPHKPTSYGGSPMAVETTMSSEFSPPFWGDFEEGLAIFSSWDSATITERLWERGASESRAQLGQVFELRSGG